MNDFLPIVQSLVLCWGYIYHCVLCRNKKRQLVTPLRPILPKERTLVGLAASHHSNHNDHPHYNLEHIAGPHVPSGNLFYRHPHSKKPHMCHTGKFLFVYTYVVLVLHMSLLRHSD